MLCFLILFSAGCSDSSVLLSDYSYNKAYSDVAQSMLLGNVEYQSLPSLMTDRICYVKDETLSVSKANEVSTVSSADEVMTAQSILCINVSKNLPVYVKSPYKSLFPASTTKLMTALLTLQKTSPSDIVTVKEDNGGITTYKAQLCGFKQGDKVSVKTLLNCLLVYSGNDAAVILAEYISGSVEAFVDEMNREAKRIGAVDTNFVNVHGLHNDAHKMSVYDIYLILNECMKYENFSNIAVQPSYTAMYETAEGVLQYLEFEATDEFLTGHYKIPDGIEILGGKTGSTVWAKECLALSYIGQDGDLYIAVVFSAETKDSLYQQMSYLMELS